MEWNWNVLQEVYEIIHHSVRSSPISGGGGPSALKEGGCYTKALALGSPLWRLCNINQLFRFGSYVFHYCRAEDLESCSNCMGGLSGGPHGQILGLA